MTEKSSAWEEINQTSRAARIIVVSCERSPHSARKVRVRAWMKTGEMKLCHFPWGTAVPDPASTSGVPLASLDRWSCKHKVAQAGSKTLLVSQHTEVFSYLYCISLHWKGPATCHIDNITIHLAYCWEAQRCGKWQYSNAHVNEKPLWQQIICSGHKA